jgi:hypothetical protein
LDQHSQVIRLGIPMVRELLLFFAVVVVVLLLLLLYYPLNYFLLY